MASELAHPLPLTQRPWWPAARRGVTFLFFGAVLYLIVRQAHTVDWPEVLQSVRAYPLQVLLTAAGLALASYALYGGFELISRAHTGHTLSTRAVLATTFISYAFNLNFGSLIGGVAFRFRLYSRQGLEPSTISRVFGFTMLTNWLGYCVLAGGVCLLQPLPVPPAWPFGGVALRALGVALLTLAASYLAVCAFATRRSWPLHRLGHGHEVTLPSARMALLQLAASCTNWLLIGGVVYTLLQQRTDYPSALMVLLAAAVAGVITHVPAGLGVLEAVFISLLVPPWPQHELLAALLVYRAVYYLVPLALALPVFIGLEMHLKRRDASSG
ncbi:MAG TPA: lysylphosphatidylglycerol synthase domain-containing protein [Burkholderiaceae bacterium]|nr:lysylphosphatidylglycerol synthase domain-containing protein [Burkholderiaceae bacterium]